MDDMDRELEEKLHSLADSTAKRDPAAAQKSRAIFLSQISDLAVSNPPVSRLTFQSFINNLNPIRKVRLKMSPSLTSLLIAAMLFFSGGGASVAAAQNSLPDDQLYSVKVMAEQIEEALTIGTDKKLDLAVNLSGKRLDEISQLIDKGTLPQEEVLKRLQESLEKAIKLAKDNGKDTTEIVNMLHRLQEEMKRLEKLPEGQNPPPEAELTKAREMMQNQFSLINEKLKEPAPNQNQNQNQQQAPKPLTTPDPATTKPAEPNPANPNVPGNLNQPGNLKPNDKLATPQDPTQLTGMPTPMPTPTLSADVPTLNPNINQNSNPNVNPNQNPAGNQGSNPNPNQNPNQNQPQNGAGNRMMNPFMFTPTPMAESES